MSGSYYEKLRTVYEHHLDERVRGKMYAFPSPKYLINPTGFKSGNSHSDALSPRSDGILKSPKSDTSNKNKAVRF